MHICLGSCESILLIISFGEKCLPKSLHSCGSVVFTSSKVIGEIGQKQHSRPLYKGRFRLLELVAGNAWISVVLRRTIMSFFWTILIKFLDLAFLLCFILIRKAFPAHCRDVWCHLWETWELGDGRVYSTVNHHVWCGLSVRVRGELLAWCSHRDLMRWFSCSNVPSAALCNSEAPTHWLLWPACVTSTFVRIRDVAHNPETCRIAAAEPGTSGLSVSVVCGFSWRMVRDTRKNKKITVWPILWGTCQTSHAKWV